MRISDWSSDVCSSDLQHVVGQYDAHHGALEQQQVGVELAHRVFCGEIVARVGDDQQADGQNEAGKEKLEAVDDDGDVEAEHRQPLPSRLDDLASEKRQSLGLQQDEGEEGDAEGDSK